MDAIKEAINRIKPMLSENEMFHLRDVLSIDPRRGMMIVIHALVCQYKEDWIHLLNGKKGAKK